VTTVEGITADELQLAARNHGMPLEAMRHDLTPVGLHYLLVHYDIPVVDPAAWRLTITGRVRRRMELSLEDLRARPAVTQVVTMECAGNGRARLMPRPISQPWLLEAVGNSEWTGVRLADLLDDAGLDEQAVELVFTGLDRGVEGGIEQSYERSLTTAEARRDEVVLAYALNGQPLPPQHGFPVRLLVPGWYGMTSVKWLDRITAVAEPFGGYQQTRAYRYRQEPDEIGEPVNRIAVRSLMVPPGIPDFLTRRRFVQPGPCPLTGRAWSGHGPITTVEVSVDGGERWDGAAVTPAAGPHGWHGWAYTWDAQPGEHELCSRATDAAGNSQPLAPVWNLGGYAVNAVQRIPVLVSATRAA
jgi:DMSO/TMAO reductase YedYZ molybdopterin-dependent catalytic subunit